MDERMLAKNVQDPGYPARATMKGLSGVWAKDEMSFVGARAAQALLDIRACFFSGERGCAGMCRDALANVPELGAGKLLFNFRLAGQNDLNALLRQTLKFDEQTNLL